MGTFFKKPIFKLPFPEKVKEFLVLAGAVSIVLLVFGIGAGAYGTGLNFVMIYLALYTALYSTGLID